MPSAVKRTILAAPTTANILRREYCSAAAAITNGVNGNGGGATEASASAHAAFFATLDFTCARRRFDRGFSRPFSPARRSIRFTRRHPTPLPTVDVNE